MRVNIYNEEIKDEVRLVGKTANTVRFHGIQFVLHNMKASTPVDQEKPPCVTFWVNDDPAQKQLLLKVFGDAIDLLTKLPDEQQPG